MASSPFGTPENCAKLSPLPLNYSTSLLQYRRSPFLCWPGGLSRVPCLYWRSSSLRLLLARGRPPWLSMPRTPLSNRPKPFGRLSCRPTAYHSMTCSAPLTSPLPSPTPAPIVAVGPPPSSPHCLPCGLSSARHCIPITPAALPCCASSSCVPPCPGRCRPPTPPPTLGRAPACPPPPYVGWRRSWASNWRTVLGPTDCGA